MSASPHAHSTRPSGPGPIPPRPASEAELQQTVKHMVNRSLQGLEEHLLRALRPTTPAAAVADNLSLPSPCKGTSQREHGVRVTDEAESHESPAYEALATGVTSPLTVQQPPVPAKTKQRIVRGAFIDFNSLLPEALYPPKHGAPPIPPQKGRWLLRTTTQ